MNKITMFLKNDSGATAIEYSLLAAGIGLAVMTGAAYVGKEVALKFKKIGNVLNGTETAPEMPK